MRIVPVASLTNPNNESKIGNLPFTVAEKRGKVKIDLNEVSAIYRDDFISKLSRFLRERKMVEVCCGMWDSAKQKIRDFDPKKLQLGSTDKLRFIISELIYGDVAKKILSMDDLGQRVLKFNIRYSDEQSGFFKLLFSLFSKKKEHELPEISVTIQDITYFEGRPKLYDEQISMEDPVNVYSADLNNQVCELEKSDPLRFYMPHFYQDDMRSKNIVPVFINACVPNPQHLREVDYGVNLGGGIEVLRLDLSEIPRCPGIRLVRTGFKEITINLNGRENDSFDRDETMQYYLILSKIIQHFRSSNHTVLVNWDLENPDFVRVKLNEDPFNFSDNDFKIKRIRKKNEISLYTITEF